MLWLAVLLVIGLGFANQRGSTCAVAAADEVITARTFHRIAGFAVAAAVSAAFLAVSGSGPRMAALSGLACITGGMVGALGAALNGRCAMGTIASLGRGRIDRLATLVGFFIGALIVLRAGGWQAAEAMQVPRLSVSAGAIAAALGALAWFLARDRRLATPGWMALIGLLNAVLIWRMTDWSYTGGLTRLAAGGMIDQAYFWLFLAALVGGSVLAAVTEGTFSLRPSSARAWLQSALGGLLLGAGSALVPGSNDAMLLVGVPLLVPGLILAYASFWITLLALRYQRWVSRQEPAVVQV